MCALDMCYSLNVETAVLMCVHILAMRMLVLLYMHYTSTGVCWTCVYLAKYHDGALVYLQCTIQM